MTVAGSPAPYYDDGTVVIYCGDCREVLPALGVRAAVTITSPPYWDARAYGGIEFDGYDGHLAWIREVMGALAPSTDWLVWIAGYIWRDGRLFDCPGDAARIAEEVGLVRRQQAIWVKPDYAPQPSIDLAPAHELIEVFAGPAAAFSNWDAMRVTRRTTTRMGRLAADRAHEGAQRGGGVGWSHGQEGDLKQAPNVFVVPKLNGHERMGHPAAFPMELVTPWVAALSRPGDLILDPFAGSGTTLRAAKDAGRRAIGIEINADYCEIAARRLGQGVLI